MTVSSLNSANSVIIVGAGMAGLSAALRLKELGIHSLVIEKSRGVGGRLATRRMKVGEKTAYLDHGAQFFTVRSSEFGAWLKPLQETHSVQNWFAAQKDSHPRWVGIRGMADLAKTMRDQLSGAASFMLDERVVSIRPGGKWEVVCESGKTFSGSELLLTPPVPQTLDLIKTFSEDLAGKLGEITYHPCIALLATLQSECLLPAPGFMREVNADIFTIADNQRKGISPEQAAVTIHATSEFSRLHWDAPDAEISEKLWGQAAPWVGARAFEIQVKRWKFSEPKTIFRERFFQLDAGVSQRLFCAGDAFGGPRVEGAFLSGRAAAEKIAFK